MRIRSVHLLPRLTVIGFALLTACAPAVNAPATNEGQTDPKALAQEALVWFDRMRPTPYPCDSGLAESQAGYVLAVAEWAEQAGLRPGDRIVAIGGTPAATAAERVRALTRIPTGGPFLLEVKRQGQPITLSLPCRYRPDLFAAERRTLQAAGRGDWTGCIVAAREVRRLAGFTAYRNILWEYLCTRAFNSSMPTPGDRDFVALHSEIARLLLRESRYVPGGTETVRETILRMANDLRRHGLAADAHDLEMKLQAVLATLPRLQLTWTDNSLNEDGFLVERKVGEGETYQPLARLPRNTSSYVDTSVEEGVTYCYRVKAFIASSYSDPTNEACARPSTPTSSSGGGGG